MNEFELLNPEKSRSRAKLSLQIQKTMAAKQKRKPVLCIQRGEERKGGVRC